MNGIKELTLEQKAFGKAVAEWKADYFHHSFNMQAWLQIEEHMRQYFRKYNCSICDAPVFEVYCCYEILEILKENQNHSGNDEMMAEDFIVNGFSSWNDERTDDFYYQLLRKKQNRTTA